MCHTPAKCVAHAQVAVDLSKQLKRFRHPASTRIDGIWESNFNFFENSSLHISILLVPSSAKGKLRVGLTTEGFQIHHVSLFFFISLNIYKEHYYYYYYLATYGQGGTRAI